MHVAVTPGASRQDHRGARLPLWLTTWRCTRTPASLSWHFALVAFRLASAEATGRARCTRPSAARSPLLGSLHQMPRQSAEIAERILAELDTVKLADCALDVTARHLLAEVS